MKRWRKEAAVMLTAVVLLLGGLMLWQGQRERNMDTPEKRAEKILEFYGASVFSEIETEEYVVCSIGNLNWRGFAVFVTEDGGYKYQGGTMVETDGTFETDIFWDMINGESYHILISAVPHMERAEVFLRHPDTKQLLHEETIYFENKDIALMKVPEGIKSWSPSAVWYDKDGNTYITE